MKKLIKSSKDKIFELKDLDANNLIYRAMPHLAMEALRKYFRMEVSGAENLPRRGAALITPNHSGYSGFDALLLSHEIYRACGRVPRVLTHPFWFWFKATAEPAEKAGFVEATMQNGLTHLRKNNLVILFPEGEQGNFKPTLKRYHMQKFKHGFVRMALRQQCPIIPTLVIGAEETHINIADLKLPKSFGGLTVPVPLNLIPLPARWRIVFLPPIHLPYQPNAADDRELVTELAQEIRENMQQALSHEVAKRVSVYF